MTSESAATITDIAKLSKASGQELGRQAATGGILLVGARMISRVFDLVTMLILARLLEPSDFGIVAIAASVVGVLDVTLDLPINQALLRLPEITKAQYDTAFTLSLLRGFLLTVVLMAAAVPIARGILSLAPVLRSLISPRLAEYQKRMIFSRDLAIEFSGKLAGFACAVAIAVATHSYWSLPAGTVSFAAVMAIVSYFLAPYRPRLSLGEWPIFAGFLGWVSAGQVINALNWQCERLLLGTLKSAAQLGLFSTASDITSIAFLAMFGPISRPLLAAFSHLRDDPTRLARSYQSAAKAAVAAGLPVLVGISILADPIVHLILGPKWLGSVILVHWLSLSLIPALFAVPAYALIMAFGQTALFFRRNVLEFAIKFPIALIGVWKFGFSGLIVARMVSEVGVDLFSIITVKRLIGLSIFEQVWGPWRSIASSIVMVPAVLWCNDEFIGAGTILYSFMHVASASFIGAIVYCGTSGLLWHLSGRPPGPEAMAARAWHRFSSRKMHRGMSESPLEETENLSPKASFGATEI
jgi:PST family polysaccharide transporter